MGLPDPLLRPFRRGLRELGWLLGDLLGPRAWRRRWQAIAGFPRMALWWLGHVGSLIAELFRKENRVLCWKAMAVLPVLVVAFSLVFFLALSRSATRRANNWYAQQAEMALAKKEYAKARLGYQGLMQYEPERAEYRFGLAMALVGLGDNATAHVLIGRLAPEDAAGYAPAQNIVAEQLLRSKEPISGSLDVAEKHLLNALKTDPDSPQAHTLLAVVYGRKSRWDLASRQLANAGPEVGEIGLVAAQACVKQGDSTHALEWTHRASDWFSTKAKQDPADDDARLNWAQATVMLRDLPGALEILDTGWKQTQKPIYPRAIAQVTAWWLAHSQEKAPRKLALLEYGLRCNGQEPILLRLVLDPDTLSDAAQIQPTTRPVAGAMMRALCASVSACRQKHAERARSELELALKLGDSSCVAVAANVACTWAYAGKPDPDSALLLATVLRELRPDNIMARRAQGLVLAKMQRWQESLACLEPVAMRIPDDTKIHETMADAYDQTGQPDLAARHRALAQPAIAPTTGPTTVPASTRP